MSTPAGEQVQTRYLVELRGSAEGWGALEELAEHARSTAAELRREGTRVLFLRTIFVPEDEACFLLYEAPSAKTAAEAAERAALTVVGVREAVQTGPVESTKRREKQ